MGSLEQLSEAIGQLSCLDRMVDRAGQAEQSGGATVAAQQEDLGPLRISRLSTMSNTDSLEPV